MSHGVVDDPPSRRLLVLHVGWNGSSLPKPLPDGIMVTSMDFEVSVILGPAQWGTVDHSGAVDEPEDRDPCLRHWGQCQYGQTVVGVSPNISFQSTSVPVSGERLNP